MTGLIDLNFPRFNAATARLRALGHDVVSPVELNEGLDHEGWAACMKRDIAAILTCDTVALLEDWHRSRGARLERHMATELGLRVVAEQSITWRGDGRRGANHTPPTSFWQRPCPDELLSAPMLRKLRMLNEWETEMLREPSWWSDFPNVHPADLAGPASC